MFIWYITLKNKLNNAIKKSLIGNVGLYLIQLMTLIILARVFTPYEFGVVASLQVFVVFFQMLSNAGIGPALINEDEINNEKRDGIFSCTLFLGVSLALLFYLFSFYLNHFFDSNNYSKYSVIISISIIFQCLTIIPFTSLQKDLKFYTISLVSIVSEVISIAMIIGLYFKFDFGIYALLSKSFFQSLFKFILSYVCSKDTVLGRPRFGSGIFHIKSIFSFSLFQFGSNFVNYFSRNSDNILVGKFIGLDSLGIYDKAYQLMRYPLQLITFSITPAIQPVLAEKKDDINYIVNEHYGLCKRLLLVSIPVGLFFFMNSELIVHILLGEKWDEVIPVITIFSFIIPLQIVMSSAGAFYISLNKVKLLFKACVIIAAINFTLVLVSVNIGSIIAVALAICASYTFNYFLIYGFLFKRVFKKGGKDFIKLNAKVLFNYIPMFIIYPLTMIFMNQYFEFTSKYFEFIVIVIVSVIEYLIIYRKNIPVIIGAKVDSVI